MIQLLDFSVSPDNAMTAWRGDLIVGPVWNRVKGTARPVCFVQGESNIDLLANVSSQKPVPDTKSIALRARSNGPSYLTFEGSFSGAPGVHAIRMRRTKGSISLGVRKTSLQLHWSYAEDGVWKPLQSSGPIVVYQVLSYEPQLFPPYDLALDLACTYVNGSSRPVEAICQGIAKEIFYRPSQASVGSALNIYDGKSGNCTNHAAAMVLLCKAIGLDEVESVYLWGGERNVRFKYQYRRNGKIFRPSIQLSAPQNDGALQNPHFEQHVQVRFDSKIFDPSYGTEGRACILETAENKASVMYGDEEPIRNEPGHWCCPH